VSCSGDKVSTSVVKGTADPEWGQTFDLPISDGTRFLEVKVKHKGLIGKKLLGAVRIPMVEVASGGSEGIDRWFTLLSADNHFQPGTSRGEVMI